MILGVGRAPGKVILFGEHAVVYGRPALAVPVTQVWAEATVEAAAPGAGLTIYAADLGEEIALRDAPADHPLAAAVRLALLAISAPRPETNQLPASSFQLPAPSFQPPASSPQLPASSFQPDWRITIRSTIPIASGMGSGAAVTAAIMRAIAEAIRRQSDATAGPASGLVTVSGGQKALTPTELSALVYEVERLYHGTPSGIDNTVVVHGRPVYFVRGRPPQPFAIGRPFMLAIADTGIRSPTRIAVGDVRRAWEQDPARFEERFDRIAAIVEAARAAIVAGQSALLGPLMDENHALLREIGVSCAELDALAEAARGAGALGAKLSGAGRGGNLIALITEETAADVTAALAAAGAVRVIVTTVKET